MNRTRAEERFFQSTRGRIMSLLRRRTSTVDELARDVGLTDNAIRTHLVALERDGLVRQDDVRRGMGKPAYTYTLTPQAERFFPKAYSLVLAETISVLAARLPREDVAGIFRDVGHRLAAHQPAASGALPERIDRALALLEDLGGLAEAGQDDAGYHIRGHSCPIAQAVETHPDACLAAETMLSDVIDTPVRADCDHGAPPRCRFAVLETAHPGAGNPPGEGGMPG